MSSKTSSSVDWCVYENTLALCQLSVFMVVENSAALVVVVSAVLLVARDLCLERSLAITATSSSLFHERHEKWIPCSWIIQDSWSITRVMHYVQAGDFLRQHYCHNVRISLMFITINEKIRTIRKRNRKSGNTLKVNVMSCPHVTMFVYRFSLQRSNDSLA